jgi:hypothetical protein
MHRIVYAAFFVQMLSGCSAAILATGTSELDIIRKGTTKAELTQRLGEPVRVDPVGPYRAWDLRKPGLNLLIEGTWVNDASGKPQNFQTPTDEITEMALYRYAGSLKRKHDVGEAASLGLMTFGASEILMAPTAIAERSTQEHLLVVWLDQRGTALAYEWKEWPTQ